MENHFTTRNRNHIQLKECRRMNDESDRHPPPHKIPPYHHTSVLSGNSLVLERRILFLASTECGFTLRWETRDRVDKTMETLWIPVQISTTSLLQKLPTASEDRILVSWTAYMRLLNCVVLRRPFDSYSWSRNLDCALYSRDSVFTPLPPTECSHVELTSP